MASEDGMRGYINRTGAAALDRLGDQQQELLAKAQDATAGVAREFSSEQRAARGGVDALRQKILDFSRRTGVDASETAASITKLLAAVRMMAKTDADSQNEVRGAEDDLKRKFEQDTEAQLAAAQSAAGAEVQAALGAAQAGITQARDRVAAEAADLTGDADALEGMTSNSSSAVTDTVGEMQGYMDETTNAVAAGTEKLRNEMAGVQTLEDTQRTNFDRALRAANGEVASGMQATETEVASLVRGMREGMEQLK